jgi:hypothetical protein
VFQRESNTWTMSVKLTAPETSSKTLFGYAVAVFQDHGMISGGDAISGSGSNSTYTGI